MQQQATAAPQPSQRDSGGVEHAIAPRLGGATLLFLLLLLALQVVLAPASPSLVWEPAGPRTGLWLGTMWAGVSTAVWMLASAPIGIGRLLMLAVAIFWHGWWMHDHVETPLARYVISMGTFGLLQSALGHLAAVPGWSLPVAADPQVPAVRRRFGIASLLVITTLAAVVLATTRRYEAPEGFLIGTVAAAIGLAAVAVSGQLAMTASRGGGLWALAMLLCIVAAVVSLAVLSELLQTGGAEGGGRWWTNSSSWKFLPVFLTFAAMVTGIATCGRLDYELHRVGR